MWPRPIRVRPAATRNTTDEGRCDRKVAPPLCRAPTGRGQFSQILKALTWYEDLGTQVPPPG